MTGRALILTAGMIAWPWSAWAQTTVCQSTGYCDNAMACQPWDSVLEVTAASDGTATLTWDGVYPVEGEVVLKRPTLIVVSTDAEGTGSMLVVGENGQATYSTATDFGDYLIAGFYSLTCSRT